MKRRQNLKKLKIIGLASVLVLAVATLVKIDASVKVYAANSNNVAESIQELPEVSSNPVSSGIVTSPFGERVNPITEEYEFHKGTDVAAPEGTPIKLAFAGVVTEVGENEIYGNYVLVNHGNELYTRYCHCSRILVQTGYNLKSGELVALVGNTGWSTGPHLHLEVISNGKYCDPEWLFEW